MTGEPISPASVSKKWLIILLIFIGEAMILYWVPRSNFVGTFTLFILLFALFVFIVRSERLFSLKDCIWLAVGLRILAVFSVPELSDDYFRFIWDGKMILEHINPFRLSPLQYLEIHPNDPYYRYLYLHMNSQEYRSVYPPVLQFIFVFSVWMSPVQPYWATVIMKCFILAGECLAIKVLYRLALKKNIAPRNILYYLLNPMIIIELTGNVHFEGLMLYFFALALLYVYEERYLLSAVFWALSISTKMIPLMLAPLLLRHLGVKKFLLYGTVSALTCIVLFIPFYSKDLFRDLNGTLSLFYYLFEFNASIFYLIRTIAYNWVDYDVIEETAPLLGQISFFIILAISFWPSRKKINLETKSIWIFLIYFLFATMVHPWYISIMVMLAVLSRYRFPVVFSLLILLSYFPYSLVEYDEDMVVILIEYLLLGIYLFFEWLKIRRSGRSSLDLLFNIQSAPNETGPSGLSR